MSDPFIAGLCLGFAIGWSISILICSWRHHRKEQKLLDHWLRTIELLEQSEAENERLRNGSRHKLGVDDPADWWKGSE